MSDHSRWVYRLTCTLSILLVFGGAACEMSPEPLMVDPGRLDPVHPVPESQAASIDGHDDDPATPESVDCRFSGFGPSNLIFGLLGEGDLGPLGLRTVTSVTHFLGLLPRPNDTTYVIGTEGEECDRVWAEISDEVPDEVPPGNFVELTERYLPYFDVHESHFVDDAWFLTYLHPLNILPPLGQMVDDGEGLAPFSLMFRASLKALPMPLTNDTINVDDILVWTIFGKGYFCDNCLYVNGELLHCDTPQSFCPIP